VTSGLRVVPVDRVARAIRDAGNMAVNAGSMEDIVAVVIMDIMVARKQKLRIRISTPMVIRFLVQSKPLKWA
jgi:hypothetical protein